MNEIVEASVRMNELAGSVGMRVVWFAEAVDMTIRGIQKLALFRFLEEPEGMDEYPYVTLWISHKDGHPRNWLELEFDGKVIARTTSRVVASFGNSVPTCLSLAMADIYGMQELEKARRKILPKQFDLVDPAPGLEDESQAFVYELKNLLDRYGFVGKGPLKISRK